jgi:hypothetical protein
MTELSTKVRDSSMALQNYRRARIVGLKGATEITTGKIELNTAYLMSGLTPG